MKKMILVVISSVFIFGCSSIPVTPVELRSKVCQDNPNSFLYDKLHNPEAFNAIILFGNSRAIDLLPDRKTKLQTIQLFSEIMDKTIGFLDQDGVTYASLIIYLGENITYINKYVGDDLFLLTPFLSSLNYPLPISPCDKSLLVDHLKLTKQMLDKKKKAIQKGK